MRKRNHVIAAVMCAVMLLSLFVSSAYILRETAHPHACEGEHCPTCQFIAQIEKLLGAFSAALLALSLVCLVLTARRERRVWTAACVPALCTPVGMKTRLND